jgi:hypothetical protein
MKPLILLFPLIAVLLGCATPMAQYGNLVANAPTGMNVKLVADTVSQLESLYPPATTKLMLEQSISSDDEYGLTLLTTLRNKGYAVQEYFPQQPATDINGIGLAYVIDVPEKAQSNIYRIKIKAGTNTLTRAYEARNEAINPAGAWSRRMD